MLSQILVFREFCQGIPLIRRLYPDEILSSERKCSNDDLSYVAAP